jgi:hypothetical protein
MANAVHPPVAALLTLPVQAGRAWACLPFDLLRAQHARAVQAGWLPRSMLAARDFEHTLAALEGLTLGPLARRV